MVMEVDGIRWGTSVEKVLGSLSGVSRFVFILCCTTSVLIGKNVCFCCVRFCFSIPSQEIGSGNVSEMT